MVDVFIRENLNSSEQTQPLLELLILHVLVLRTLTPTLTLNLFEQPAADLCKRSSVTFLLLQVENLSEDLLFLTESEPRARFSEPLVV